MDILSTSAVLIGPLLILGVIVYTYVQANLDKLRDEWTTYRCNPLYMPFAGGIQPEVSTLENYQFCVNMMSQNVFALLMEPVNLMFGVFTGLVGMITHDLGYFRNFVSGIMTFIMSFIGDIFSKIQNTFGVMVNLLARVRDLTSRILGSAGYAATIMITTINMIKSLWSLLVTLINTIVTILFALSIVLSFVFPPLLVFAIFLGSQIGLSFCFHPDTLIHVEGRGLVKVSDVKVGDVFREGCEVTATMQCLAAGVPLYTYEGVVVSGEHLVLENGKWKYVKDTSKSIPFMGPNPRVIYCFNTTDHRVPIGQTIFADYEEIEEPPNYEVLDPSDKVTTALGHTPLMLAFPGMPTWDGVIKAVVNLPNGKMQVFMGNRDGMFMLNGKRMVRDYPDSHDPAELAKIQERVLAELNGDGNKNVAG
jgi:hypothetical protein